MKSKIHEHKNHINMNVSKKIIIATLITISSMSFAQVIIGDKTGTAADKTSVLLEFAEDQNKGLVLPYTRTLPSGAGLAEGTIILDATDDTKARVKFYNGTWQDLSGQDGIVTTALANQPATGEDANAKAIIGAQTSSADGVLVLESTDKAMVLPMVNSTGDIPKPAPGMMVYINKAGAKRLAVFNGNKWSYWKP